MIPDPIPEPSPIDSRRTILVIDDDEAVLGLVGRVLRLHGYEVIQATSAHAARETVGDVTPDMLIMDLVLPGMDGREAANYLLARSPEVPVLFISGYTRQDVVRLGPLAPGHAFLQKPFDLKELLTAVENALG